MCHGPYIPYLISKQSCEVGACTDRSHGDLVSKNFSHSATLDAEEKAMNKIGSLISRCSEFILYFPCPISEPFLQGILVPFSGL